MDEDLIKPMQLIVEIRIGVRAKTVEISNPSLSEVLSTIDKLDGDTSSLVTLELTDRERIMIGGGLVRFICTADKPGRIVNVLSEQFDDRTMEELMVGGQFCNYPRRYVLDKTIVARACGIVMSGGELAKTDRRAVEVLAT